MKTITNPILKGFNPDPSILRVGDDYYIATSTFQWFPGVQIHHSRDLVNWELIGHVLDRASQLDMQGEAGNSGIWAPCLTYDDGLFYLIYTDMRFWNGGRFRDQHNYIVTSPSIEGPWSDPTYLNSSGFDPSLFHDNDGRKYLVNMLWDYRFGRNQFAGIVLQEYSANERKLIGPITNIFTGTHLGLVEGPHLYKRNGFYYLLVAEGGTRFEHAVTLARSKNLLGPYEVHPQNPILTSWDDATLELQRAGHASLVETQDGQWYMAHLCGRPIPNRGICILGRETAIQKMEWHSDGWPFISGRGHSPCLQVEAPDSLEWHPFPTRNLIDHFDDVHLDVNFQVLRTQKVFDHISLKDRPGFLRLYGAESLNSLFIQSLVARRQQAFRYSARTCIDFNPVSFQHMAGLVVLYNENNFCYFYLSFEEGKGCVLNIYTNRGGIPSSPLHDMVCIPLGIVHLGVDVDYHLLQFSFSLDGRVWSKVGPALDATGLGDESCEPHGFTGAFVGICCQDMSGQGIYADFDYFSYEEKEK
ncbi:MAG: glycoside hydrolase family 43 protein [Mesotoga sp.]|uniref:glycoside hydrolase family 43 protein n=1 Tax=Mesotoga sp. TaxID=2053577 RepID=UPI003569A60C